MKTHSTNYVSTFLAVADDCPVTAGEAPPLGTKKTAARQEYEMLLAEPYVHTSDDVIYAVRGRDKGISRGEFFSKGQPCFRTSALTKRYGWGVHFDEKARMAIYPAGSAAYEALKNRGDLTQLKAARSKKA